MRSPKSNPQEASIANTSKLQREIGELKKDKEELHTVYLVADEEAAELKAHVAELQPQLTQANERNEKAFKL